MIHPDVVRQGVERMRGHVPDLLHRAVRIKPEEPEIVADVPVTRRACRTIIAMVQRSYHDLLPNGDARHTVPDGRDSPGHLVPDHAIQADPCIHVAVKDMHVGPAYPAVGDANRNLARPRIACAPRLDGEGPVPPVECCRDFLVHAALPALKFRPAASCAASSFAQSKETPMPGSFGATAR